jgi:CDP-glucose 4,6-dehydratase
MESTTWRGRRVFVTGHTGFKGSWLCASLVAAGARVSGFALAPETHPNMYDLAEFDREVDSTIGDVRNADDVAAAMVRAQPDVVFHLAAQPIVRVALADPVGTYATNIMGTVHVLDAVRTAPTVAAVVVVTSDKCYENTGRREPYDENDTLGGADPYSSSKGAAELVAAAYRRTYFAGGPALATARAGNVIGGGDWSRDRLVPDIVRALVADRDPQLRYPGAMRPWQHVLDAIAGYELLAEHLLAEGSHFARSWNFGPAPYSECTVVDLAELFLAAWGTRHRPVIVSQTAPHEEAILRLDSDRARSELGWLPAHDLMSAVHATARWYRAWHDGDDVRERTYDDVAAMRRKPAAKHSHAP